MRNVIKVAIAATALGGATLAAVQPAEARDNTGVAIAAGILGLGVGAAIASADRPHHYDAGYQPYYGGPGYYAPSYGVVYQNGYGYRGYDRGYHHGWDRDDRRHWDRPYDRDRDDWRR